MLKPSVIIDEKQKHVKSGMAESSRKEHREERRSRDMESSEARQRSHRTESSEDFRCIESRRSTVPQARRRETSAPGTKQEQK